MTNRIAQLRKERKISQAELADAVDVTRQTIISLESGRYNASLPVLTKIQLTDYMHSPVTMWDSQNGVDVNSSHFYYYMPNTAMRYFLTFSGDASGDALEEVTVYLPRADGVEKLPATYRDTGRWETDYYYCGDNPPTGSCPTTVSKAEADRMVYENIIPGSDGWNPRAMMQRLPAPKAVKADGAQLTWQPVSGAIGYVVLSGNEVVGITAEPKLTAKAAAAGKQLRVRAVNRYGTLGE